jgi:RNA recognition motif-containing protein
MPVRLFVGNLPYDATEDEIREHFSAIAPVSYVFMPIDRETGKKRGFAFVEFDKPEQAQEAIRQFNDQPFKGRPLAVNEARARESRPASPGTGGFRPAGGPRPPFAGRPPDSGFSPGSSPDGRSERPSRRFGPDSKPARARSQRFLKPEGTKRSFKERYTGQLFGVDDEGDSRADAEIDDFATGVEGDEEK